MLSPRDKILIKVFLVLVAVLAVIGITGITTAYIKQDKLVENVITDLNNNFAASIELGGSHISPFKNFPYISVDLEHLMIYEGKSDTSELILSVADAYIGFDLWSLLDGSYDIKRIRLEDGFFKLVQHVDGSFNIVNAFETQSDSSSSGELHLDLQKIQLTNIDLVKLNESSDVLVEAYIWSADSRYKTNPEGMEIGLDTDFTFNLIVDRDTTFLHHKNVKLNTDFSLDFETDILEIEPSEIYVESALFNMEGDIDIQNNMDLDLTFKGEKPNFDLFLAFVPEEVTPLLERYDNGGLIYFDATVKGPSINGQNPLVKVDFGCSEAFVHNVEVNKEVNELFFDGHFTNGSARNMSTTSLRIEDFSARPETGVFFGNLEILNFDSPDINLQLTSDFDLEFLVEFLNVEGLSDVSGGVSLEMNFHDIIDLSQPEKSIEKLNESYFTKLNVKDLSFKMENYPLAFKDLNIKAFMDGHEAKIEQLDFRVGESDLAITASVSDLPAIIHHTDIPVDVIMDLKSSMVNLAELTGNVSDSTQGIDEQVKNLSLKLKFNSTARAFTESPNLPLGEFFIDELFADLTHYPHQLHDFSADIYVDSSNFRIIDFTGMIDESDFHFNGKLKNYDLWFERKPKGSTQIDFNFTSDLLHLEDLFSYGGENFVPEDYRHEEFKDLKIHGIADLKFDNKLARSHIDIDMVEASMKVHPMRFEQFKGEFIIDSAHIDVKEFGGKLGKSEFITDFTFYFDSTEEKHNYFHLRSPRLDFDELFAYTPPPADKVMTPEDHEAGFNIFELPFSNMDFDLEIDHLNYHRYLLDEFQLKGRSTKNHYLYIDTLGFKTAGGNMGLNGYFNGSDPSNIYFSPNIHLNSIDLDRLLFKFENFGQYYLVSENLHGKLSGDLSGKIHMHADMVPIVDDSEMHMDIEVVNGSLNNYSAFEVLSDYFTDKNLSQIRFDTLSNSLDLKDGTLYIPEMTLNTSLGYFKISGEQSLDTENLQMEYYLSIPWKVVTRAGFQKLFSKKDQDNTEQVDEIQYQDESKKTRFLNVRIKGTPDEYDVKLGKKKD